MNTHPLLGARVLYTLNDQDAASIVQQRNAAGKATLRGNDPRAGDVCTAIIVRVFGPTDPKWEDDFEGRPDYEQASLLSAWNSFERPENRHVNLQVFLDGNDTLWATSRTQFTPDVHGRRVLLESPNDLGAHDDEAPTRWVPDPRGHWTRA